MEIKVNRYWDYYGYELFDIIMLYLIMMIVFFFVWVDYLIIVDLLFFCILIFSMYFFDLNKYNEI